MWGCRAGGTPACLLRAGLPASGCCTDRVVWRVCRAGRRPRVPQGGIPPTPHADRVVMRVPDPVRVLGSLDSNHCPPRDNRRGSKSAVIELPAPGWQVGHRAARVLRCPGDGDRRAGDFALRGGVEGLLHIGEAELGVDQFVEGVGRLVSLQEVQCLAQVAGF